MTPVSIRTGDGWVLRGELLGSEQPKVVVVLGHAMMVSRRTLRGLAGVLAERGAAVLNVDLRGHGESTPRASRSVDWSYDDLVEHDTPALVNAARERFPRAPLVLVGHSLFGHVAAAWLGLNPGAPVRALVGLGANVWLKRFEPDRWRWVRKRAWGEVIAAAIAVAGYGPIRRLRAGTDDEARTYFRQLAELVRHDRWTSLGGVDYLAALKNARVPMLNVVGARDRMLCVPECAALMWREWGGRFEQWVIDEARVARPPGHMGLVLNPACRPVWESVSDWIASVAAEAAPG